MADVDDGVIDDLLMKQKAAIGLRETVDNPLQLFFVTPRLSD